MTRRFSVRFLMLALVPVLVALALLPAAAHASFGNTTFNVALSDTQAAGHPNLAISLNRTGSENVKNLVLDLPPGLLANPESVSNKCSSFYFSLDWCAASATVGDMSVDVTALGFLPLNDQTGSVYVLKPDSNDAATLGLVLRPTGSGLGVINKSYIKDHVTIRSDSDYGLKNTQLNLPQSTAAVLFVPVPIAINNMDLNLHSRAGSGSNPSGPYFMQNASLCAPATSYLNMTSYAPLFGSSSSASNSSTYTPTGCGSVPFNPAFGATVSNPSANQFTGGVVTVALDQTDAPIQPSAIKTAQVTYPQGTSLNFTLIGGIATCSEAQLSADTCPASSTVGTASSNIPALPPTFTGTIYNMAPSGSTLNLAVVLHGPRHVIARIRGAATVVGIGTAQRVVATFDNAPQYPIADLTMNFSQAILRNPQTCGSNTISATFTGYSGAVATRTATYTTVNCPPDTNITSTPANPTNDNTPTFGFSATIGGATFQCAIDSGTFSPCSSPYTVSPALSDGPHLFRVAGCITGTNCDLSPAQYSFSVDTVPPSLTVSSPNNGDTLTTAFIPVLFSAEGGSTTTCDIDSSGSPVSCPGSSYTFLGVNNGPHTVSVTATDAAGNTTTVTRNVTVNANTVTAPDTSITGGPQNGLHITDRTPTFSFDSSPSGAPGYECSIDGGTFTSCGSPITLPSFGEPVDTVNGDTHTFAVRAIGDLGDALGTTDPTPATTTFVEDTFNPTFDVQYLDPATNDTTPLTRAASHPDVNVTVNNVAGDIDQAVFSLPDGFWGSLAAVPNKCTQADVASGSCTSASKIGTVSITALTDDNVPHVFSSDAYMADSTGGNLANVAFNLPITIGGNDYGSWRDNAELSFAARYEIPPGHLSSVHNPKGVDTSTFALPNTSTGPDGTVNLHVSQIDLHFDGQTGAGSGHPLLTSPSTCDPEQAVGFMIDKEGYMAFPVVPYQATDCASVPFNPSLAMAFSSIAPATNTNATATVTVPDGDSTVRNAVIDLPLSIQPQFAGLADLSCQPSDTELSPPACSDATTLAGTATIATPLLATPITGKVYLEDSGNALPNLYIYGVVPGLGLEVRLRGSSQTLGSPSHIRFILNAESNGNISDAPDVPLTTLSMSLPGSAINGPILKISTQCYKSDAATGTFNGWSGATANYNQPFAFSPSCPN